MKLRLVVLAAFTCFAFAFQVQATNLIGTSPIRLNLEVNKGALLKLPKPAATIFVADPGIADIQVKSARLIYITAKQPGETTLYALDAEDKVILNRRVAVNHNISRLQGSLRHLFPNSDIDIRSVDGAMVLNGSVATASDAEDARRIAARALGNEKNLINKLSVSEPNQVQLRVRIAEVSRTVLKQIGVNWESIGSFGSFVYGLATGTDFIPDGSRTITRSQQFDNFYAGYNTGSHDINALLDALDKEGLITVLAEPNLTAVSGETAEFLAGGEFPIIVPGANNRTTVSFKKFGVSLAFTPTLIGGATISLKVKPEVSQLTSVGAVVINGFSIPALSTRRAETTVELGSGQSFAIAGLMQNNIKRDIDRFPGLADVPVLGSLFRSDEFQREESELVIIVTPYVVRPVSSQMLVLPTDGLTPPTDTDRVLHSRLYRPTLGRRPSGPNGRGATGLVGPVGFLLD
jgi:pilus assembly protein CpaC